MKNTYLIVFCTLLIAAAVIGWQSHAQSLPQQPEWMNKALPPEQRADLLVAAMTLDDKINQIAMRKLPNPDLPNCGIRNDSRQIEGIPRLAIPTIRMTNGPIGVGGGDCNPDPKATGVPTALAVAASWDAAVSFQWGDITGTEVHNNAHHIFIAPGMNLGRIPHNGRNFEYFGEDPYLAGVMSVSQIKAVQAHGVQAVAKHFVANEQETQRNSMNTLVDDRTLHELYLLPFEMSVKDANVASMMCSYPRINGVFACENPKMLNDVLRTQWGFRGYVMSDRGATQSTVPSIKGGLDLEFATPKWFTPEKLKPALDKGEITVADLDSMLKRRYYTMFRLGQFDTRFDKFVETDFTTHGKKAREIAEQGSVLLKNANGILPLNAKSLRSVALFGSKTFAGAAKLPKTGPGGILMVNAPYTVTPLEGLQNTLKTLGSSTSVTYNEGTDLAAAATLAAKADVAIVMVGDNSVEAEDRANLSLPKRDGVEQDALIAAVAAANPRTIVVLKNGGPVLMPWLDKVPAVLESWYPGQEDGNAVANLLFGVANPSGKLPLTFPKVEREAATATEAQFPGAMVDGKREARYTEGLEIGYRWYDAHHAQPLFPFGFGLSYTTFLITKLKVTAGSSDGTKPIQVQVRVKNTGKVYGAEVPQVYLHLPSSPTAKRLVAFQKVWLKPNETKTVTLTIDPSASNHPLSSWDTAKQAWAMISGEYKVSVGNSAKNLTLTGTMKVQRK